MTFNHPDRRGGAVADTTKKTEIADKLASLSQMSGEELIQMSIRGILSVGSRILIALVLLFVGRWIIKHLRKGLNRMLTNRKVKPRCEAS